MSVAAFDAKPVELTGLGTEVDGNECFAAPKRGQCNGRGRAGRCGIEADQVETIVGNRDCRKASEIVLDCKTGGRKPAKKVADQVAAPVTRLML